MKEGLIEQLKATRQFFLNSVSCLTDDDSGFAPTKETFTVAQQVEHAALTVEWFIEGAFSPQGFNLDFATADATVKKATSFDKALQHFQQAFDAAIQKIQSLTIDELVASFPPDDPIYRGAPKFIVINGIVDHTAHHRGALTVYARLLGKTPKMPYSEA
ncbi:hypothetical protein U14_04075 [Candidatus Moduliflexus flocculans]|uniref:DinB family protein n=1 Tax=Candidatus Moduliflexus flocculans TaxID=1499966 RepID=A0A0S6W347_9BACT|nr:hypothetical protein U14_04075 [Candidatus Moduliflexus flocculans]